MTGSVAAVADLALNERQLILEIVVLVIGYLTLGLHCVSKLVFDHRLWRWRPRIDAAKEAFAVAVPKLFAFSVQLEDCHHEATFPICWSVNLQ